MNFVEKVNASDDSARTADTCDTASSLDLKDYAVPQSICACSEEEEVGFLESPHIEKSSVSWGAIEVQRYPIIPGIHPDCQEGPPLTIGWEPFERQRFDSVDEFEATHTIHSDETDFRLSWYTRTKMLQYSGFSHEDLASAQDSSRKTRIERQRSLKDGKSSFTSLLRVFRNAKKGRRREY